VKLHDLKPAPGSRKAKRRVGRGIAAGQGKTAGRGTKGQKARAGGSIPAWFEGGQTPLHQRIPKLRGFKNLFKIHYEVVNLGDIARLVELGELESGEHPDSKGSRKGTPAPITVNQEILRAAGLVRRLDRPMKVLGGGGDLSTALFVVADAFSASARAKIEAAGGTVSVLEVPDTKRPALRPETQTSEASAPAPTEAEPAEATADVEPAEATAEASAEAQAGETSPAEAEPPATAPKTARATRARKATESTEADTVADDSATKPRPARKTRAAKPAPDA
jgi:large subunit ribosomal protein L15